MVTKNYYDQLVEKIKSWNLAYYQDDNPVVDDALYDAQIKELEQIEQQYPQYLRDDSPTQYAGLAEVKSKFW
jgi:DNA ligase (NAD+)